MRISTVIGYVMIASIFILALAPSGKPADLMVFIDYPSFILVFGGMLGLLGMTMSGKNANDKAKLRLCQWMTCAFFIMAVLGELIGGMQMLKYLTDPSSIGPSMAVCLLTSLYGLFAALLVSYPLEDRYSKRVPQESGLSLSRIVWFVFPIFSMGIAYGAFCILILAMSKSG